ncbi:hypothetical protein BDN72DRAFT_861163 [Pluteus cervinus]|uniref:Uncharacterized protein n=1 Tax=Pluteus cervinus TaxID=181527 RepID=A0ACD3AGL0_9AGAR|nr:hypothetical protein BDN72DRAFT_861163 [Pluteus cervinus]
MSFLSFPLTTSEDLLWAQWDKTPLKVTDKEGEDIILVHNLPDEKRDSWPFICRVRGKVDSEQLFCGVLGDSSTDVPDPNACYSFLLGPSDDLDRAATFADFVVGLEHRGSVDRRLSTVLIRADGVERLCFLLPMKDMFGNPGPLFVYDQEGCVIPREYVNERINGIDVDVSFFLLLEPSSAGYNIFGIINRVEIVG